MSTPALGRAAVLVLTPFSFIHMSGVAVHGIDHDFYSKSKALHDKAVEMVRWKPKVHAGKGTEYFIFANKGMTDRWRHDKGISVLDVVQGFEIYHGTAKGEHNRPSTGELEDHFGTCNSEEVVRLILEHGVVH